MASGMARGAAKQGKKIAFGTGHRIIWDQHSETVFRYNPNIAKPGMEHRRDIRWIKFYKGKRLYNSHDAVNNRWVWNYDFRPTPGEVFFSPGEREYAASVVGGFVLIEPNVASWKASAANKDWGIDRFQQVADRLTKDGRRVAQFDYGQPMLARVSPIKVRNFRIALAALGRAVMVITPEGGLHHAAAALKIPAVVIFGGFIPPTVTGYDFHTNIAGSDEFCGSLFPCDHCAKALRSISVDQIVSAAKERF